MSAIGQPDRPVDRDVRAPTAPELTFRVTGAEPMRLSAVPTLRFQVDITRTGGGPIESVTLSTLIRIAPARRGYRPEEKELLAEVFGAPERWGTTLRPLPWARTTTVVAPFERSTSVQLPVECTCDLELAVTKYQHAVRTGSVPLDFLFSGTILYAEDDRLKAARISWSTDTTFRLPVDLWHEATRSDDGWVRVTRSTFERLRAHRVRQSHGDWDETIDALLSTHDHEHVPEVP